MPRQFVTRQQLADIAGVTAQAVSKWHTEGLPREDDGTYDLSYSMLWLERRHLWAELGLDPVSGCPKHPKRKGWL